MSSAPDQMADHWWWRPGWRPGRRFYTWHLTFQDAPQVHELAARYRTALKHVPGLDLVPDRWLHLTMQGLGFVGEVSEHDAQTIAQAAAGRLASVPVFELELDRPVITPEAIRWDPLSAGPAAVRGAIRAAIGEVWPRVPETEEGFGAHVTIAYSNSDGPARPVSDALSKVQSSPAVALVTHADLIVLGRDRGMYEWETFASVPLAG